MVRVIVLRRITLKCPDGRLIEVRAGDGFWLVAEDTLIQGSLEDVLASEC